MDEISKLLNKYNSNSFKKLGNNPTALTKFNYISEVLPEINSYYITEKADGERAFLFIKNEKISYLTSTEEKMLNSKFTLSFSGIFDCELVKDVFFIFDVLEFNGENVSKLSFEKRLDILNKIKQELENTKNINVKKYYKLSMSTYQKDIYAAYKEKRPYKVDGLIFTKSGDDYNKTVNLKWKPPEQLTIDFIYIKDSTHSLFVGIDKRSWLLYGFPLPKNYTQIISTIKSDFEIVKNKMITKDYFPVPFVCSFGDFSKIDLKDIDTDVKSGNIIELSWDNKKNKWIFHRIRTDREVEVASGNYYGNNYKIAELTLQSSLNPLLFENLIDSYDMLTKHFYFEKTDDSYKAVRKFNNYVKDNLIRRYCNSFRKPKKVMDMASGKGQDLQKYVNAKVRELMMLEIDINAIDELIQRKYDILGKAFIDKNILKNPLNIDEATYSDKKTGCRLHIICIDLNDKWQTNIKKVVFEPDVIFCNFALHYMLYDKQHMDNICSFISHYLKKDGEFIFTALNGSKVFDLIKKEPFIVGKKYMIKLTETPDLIFKGFEKINVKLPCSETPYEEPLINIYELDKSFNTHSIIRLEHFEFTKLLDDFKKYRNGFFMDLDQDDKKFCGLYSYTVFKKLYKI